MRTRITVALVSVLAPTIGLGAAQADQHRPSARKPLGPGRGVSGFGHVLLIIGETTRT
jgi:hypothetical protein